MKIKKTEISFSFALSWVIFDVLRDGEKHGYVTIGIIPFCELTIEYFS